MDQIMPRPSQIAEALTEAEQKARRAAKRALRAAKIIRGVTVPPVCALFMLLILFFLCPGFYYSASNFAFAIVYLVALPTLAYPVAFVFKFSKDSFKNNQRKLAVIFSVIGYAALLSMVLTNGYNIGELVLYLNYVISVVLIAITTPIPHCKASGHACGAAGPIAGLSYFVSPWFLAVGAVLLTAVFWASLKLRRHTPGQLVAGALISAVCVVVAVVVGII